MTQTPETAPPKAHPCLWFTRDLDAAIGFYTAIFPDSTVHSRTDVSPGVVVAEFTVAGQYIMGMQAENPDIEFTDQFSLMVRCTDQAEVDRYWEALLADGGKEEACGWLIDRFGLRWQIVPQRLMDLVVDPDREKAARVNEAMLTMVKLDLAELEAAAAGVAV